MEQVELFKSEPAEQSRIRGSQPQEWKVVSQPNAMLEEQPFRRPEPETPARRLKIEADGDFSRGLIKPKIRLMGRWLERAGFCPGNYVHVTCVAPGVMELRCSKVKTIKETEQASTEEPY